jgi:hypothetical protein
MKDFGIVTIACGHNLYGRYAWNLTLSAKANDMGMPVTLIADADGISQFNEGQLAMFDKVIMVKDSWYTFKGLKLPLMLKFKLYDLSPYDRTLFMDADTIISPMQDIRAWSESMKGTPFTMANRGYNDPDKGISEWVDKDILKSTYDVKAWIDLSSEFIYFERSESVAKMFTDAMKFYKDDKLPMRKFAGDRPDEPFFNLAMDKNGIAPHKIPYAPTYWLPAQRKFKSAMEIKREFFGFSLGGKEIPKTQEKIYAEFAANVAYKTGVPTMRIGHKKQYLSERQVI